MMASYNITIAKNISKGYTAQEAALDKEWMNVP